MRLKTTVVAILAVLLAAILLSGCGENSNTGSTVRKFSVSARRPLDRQRPSVTGPHRQRPAPGRPGAVGRRIARRPAPDAAALEAAAHLRRLGVHRDPVAGQSATTVWICRWCSACGSPRRSIGTTPDRSSSDSPRTLPPTARKWPRPSSWRAPIGTSWQPLCVGNETQVHWSAHRSPLDLLIGHCAHRTGRGSTQLGHRGRRLQLLEQTREPHPGPGDRLHHPARPPHVERPASGRRPGLAAGTTRRSQDLSRRPPGDHR